MATVRVFSNEPGVRRSDPEGERSRHLEVVRPGVRRRLHLKLTPKTGVTLTVLLFAGLFGVAVSHALLIQSQLKLDETDKHVADEQARYEQLRLDVAELQSPDRIMADARALGMVDPAETVWLTPDESTAAGSTGTTGTTGSTGSTASTGSGSTGATADGNEADSPDTSYAEVKPYLGSTP